MCLAALSDSLWAQDEFVFTDGFEVSSRAPITSGVVELRDAAGDIKGTRSTDDSGLFAAFPSAQVDPGDSLIAFGGFWRGKPFAGEFRKLMAFSGETQTITPITTLVSTLAAADFITGSTASQRRADAVSRMTALGMIQSDWDQIAPARVNLPLQNAVEDAAGIQNWSNELIAQIEVGGIDPEHMAVFPYVNASVVEFLPLASGSQWLTGESGSGELEFQPSRDSTAGWSWSLVSGPAWVSLASDGTLSWNVPDAATPGTGAIDVQVQDLETSLTRTHSLDYGVQDGTVVASAIFDAAGGQLWAPDNSVGIEVPAGALSASAEFQLVEYTEADGSTATRFRTVPADLETLSPIRFLFDAPVRRISGSQRGGQISCPVQSPGWHQKFCLDDLFLRVRVPLVSLFVPAVSWNRLPDGLTAFDVPDDGLIYRYDTRRDVTAVLQALCDDCSGKTPVLFVHGFTRSGIGGGEGTWGDLPALLHEYNNSQEFAVYEFRYRSNARFQDIAGDLGEAIEFIHAETGNLKVNLVAHSFGGLVSRTYLQGLAPNSPSPGPFTGCGTSRHPYVDSLLTIGTPHSGIAADEGNAHGTLLPDGRDGLAGSLIAGCRQMSCWQAGARALVFLPGPGVFAPDFAALYGVEDEPGEIVVGLDDFSAHPLTVPTNVNLSMLRGIEVGVGGVVTGEFYKTGDGLIRYEGQRFSPRFSCGGASCTPTPVSPVIFDSVEGQDVGHCVEERVLGDADATQPIPGDLLADAGFLHRVYRHSGTVPDAAAVQPRLGRAEHLPGLDSAGNGLWVANHDTFNQVLDWLLPGSVDRILNLTIAGQGAVEVLSGSNIETCTGSCTVLLDATTAVLTLQPDAGAQVSSVSANCVETSPGQCEIQTPGPWTDARVEFVGGGQTQVTVTVNGSGTVDVDPLGAQCAGPVCSYTLLENTAVTLTPATGAFVNWSGFCNVIGNECLLNSGEAGTQRFVTANFLPPPEPGSTFTDCADCPTMVQIPAGTFVQGSPPDEPERDSDEGPQRTVNLPAFAMGQTEVTFDQWDACVADGGCSRNPSDFGWGRGDRPVVDVSWNDAQEYVTWLSNRTAEDYRLPSESEWEYATRAGTTGRFNTGDCITTDQANFRGDFPAQGCPTGIYRQQTLPVASFAPNAFGLYDTHGNVWEWVQDCWNGSYTGAPTDGSAWMTGDCSRAVLRGGAWGNSGRDLRSANRVRYARGGRSDSVGFRVARSVSL